MPIEIKSSKRVESPYLKAILFGEQQKGKSVTIPTAPKPLWLLTEDTSAPSLGEEIIERVYGPAPTEAEITAFVKQQEPAIKKADLEKTVKELLEDTSQVDGITRDVPTMNVFSYPQLQEAADFLKTPAASAYETIFVDSASAANKMILEFYSNKKTAAGKKMHGQLASKQAQDETYNWFKQLMALPKHIVLIFQAEESTINLGTEEDPVWHTELVPMFHGKKLKREMYHLVREIYQMRVLGKNDQGKPNHIIQVRPATLKGVERTLNPRLKDQEEANWSEILSKLTGK